MEAKKTYVSNNITIDAFLQQYRKTIQLTTAKQLECSLFHNFQSLGIKESRQNCLPWDLLA